MNGQNDDVEDWLGKGSLITAGAIVAAMWVAAAIAWAHLPGDVRIPIHWNAAGQVDGYGGKAAGLLLLPAVATALVVALPATLLLDPRRKHILQSGRFVRVVLVGTAFLMAAIYACVLAAVYGRPLPVERVAPTGVGLLFVLMGNYLGKVRSNFFVGIRTPWTLSSELSWNRTHRLCGKLFVVFGAAFIASVWLIGSKGVVAVLIIGIAAILVLSLWYSYWVWLNDPNRRTQ